MANSNSSHYSDFAGHVRTTLKPEDLSRAANALRRAADVRRRILSLHRSTSDADDEVRAEIYDLIDAPDIAKLNKLFRSPINILPCDMKYSEKAVRNAQEYFSKSSAEIADLNPVTETPVSAKFDSVDDFEAWSEQLHTIRPAKDILHEAKPIQEQNFELNSEIERCAKALRAFETKFSDVHEVPEIPNKLNVQVDSKMQQLSETIGAIDEFIKARMSIAESVTRIEETKKTVPAAKTIQDIEEILCQVENLAFPSACDYQSP